MAKTLLEVIEEQGLTPEESSGGRLVLNCPFHKGDSTASFTIYPNNTYFCFGGGCEVWGDAIKFLVDYKGMSAKEALEYVGEDYKSPKTDKSKVIKVKNTSQTYKLLYDVVLDYHEFLMQTPGALNYLSNRGLSRDTIKQHKLGYTDGNVLSIQTAWEMEKLLEVGLVNKAGFEALSHRIIIPNLISGSQCDFLIGRTVVNDTVKYLGARMPKPIHGFYSVRHSPIIFLVEGQFDWLTLRQWGYPAAVLGGSHLPKYQHILLQDKKVVIVPDYDDSGQGIKTANSLKKSLGESAMILDYSELRTSDGKLDISTLGESPGGEFLFKQIVLEQVLWLLPLSRRILSKYFPALVDLTPFPLT